MFPLRRPVWDVELGSGTFRLDELAAERQLGRGSPPALTPEVIQRVTFEPIRSLIHGGRELAVGEAFAVLQQLRPLLEADKELARRALYRANRIPTTRGLRILVARVTVRKYTIYLRLCHYFARMKSGMKTNQIAWDKTNAAGIPLIPMQTPVRNKMDYNQTGI
jgi:hypothetical protein